VMLNQILRHLVKHASMLCSVDQTCFSIGDLTKGAMHATLISVPTQTTTTTVFSVPCVFMWFCGQTVTHNHKFPAVTT